jgi:hypothetical protein
MGCGTSQNDRSNSNSVTTDSLPSEREQSARKDRKERERSEHSKATKAGPSAGWGVLPVEQPINTEDKKGIDCWLRKNRTESTTTEQQKKAREKK